MTKEQRIEIFGTPGCDWPEDFADEDNGCYCHRCRYCGKPFVGHKRRPNVCKKCANAQTPTPPVSD